MLAVVAYPIFFCSNGRNERGKEMLNLVKDLLEITPTISSVIDIFVVYFCSMFKILISWIAYFRVTDVHL